MTVYTFDDPMTPEQIEKFCDRIKETLLVAAREKQPVFIEQEATSDPVYDKGTIIQAIDWIVTGNKIAIYIGLPARIRRAERLLAATH